MQTRGMTFRAGDVVDHDPEIAGTDDGAFVRYSAGCIPVVFRFEGGDRGPALRLPSPFRGRPIEPEKPAQTAHRIGVIHGDSIVRGRPGESVVPIAAIAVQVSSRVTRDVLTLPPQVEMQLVGLAGAVRVIAAAKHRPAVRTGERVVTA